MIKFLVQTEKGKVIHDFAFHLVEAVKYNNWFYNEKRYRIIYCETGSAINVRKNMRNYIPIGSIEFVLNFYRTCLDIDGIKPINIPEELNRYEFTGRKIEHLSYSERIDSNKEVFAKSADKFKYYAELVKMRNLPLNKPLIVSEPIDIKSEWRAFVFNKELLDIRNYSGDFTVFPDIQMVNRMIQSYEDSPKAYTLDVAINDEGKTVTIEVHQFFSCGLYGFCDYTILPKMFIVTHREIIKG